MKRNLMLLSIAAGLAVTWSGPAGAGTEPGAGTEGPRRHRRADRAARAQLRQDRRHPRVWQGTVDGDISGT